MSISRDELLELALELVEDDSNQGICTDCGAVKDCVEPDADNYECDDCGEFKVKGAENIVIENA